MRRSVVDARPPTASDIAELAANMRPADVAEVQALRPGVTLRDIVQDSVNASTWCYALRVDGDLACIIGLTLVGSLLAPQGIPWMLGTPAVVTHRRALMRSFRVYIKRMLQDAPHLYNVVHADNKVAVKWLQRVGFVLLPAVAVGPDRLLFHPFEMKRNV